MLIKRGNWDPRTRISFTWFFFFQKVKMFLIYSFLVFVLFYDCIFPLEPLLCLSSVFLFHNANNFVRSQWNSCLFYRLANLRFTDVIVTQFRILRHHFYYKHVFSSLNIYPFIEVKSFISDLFIITT